MRSRGTRNVRDAKPRQCSGAQRFLASLDLLLFSNPLINYAGQLLSISGDFLKRLTHLVDDSTARYNVIHPLLSSRTCSFVLSITNGKLE